MSKPETVHIPEKQASNSCRRAVSIQALRLEGTRHAGNPNKAAKTGFTILELLVSMAVLSLLMLVLVSLTEQTRKTWKQTSQRIDAFGPARVAFESVTRNLSQATLNTYWDYDSPTDPKRYVRRSELRFASGPSLLTSGAPAPTHAVFFQAPLGYVEDGNYRGMENLLNTCGYYVQLADDGNTRPPFLNSLASPAKRTRFRLMELLEPSENLTVFKHTSGEPGYRASEWYTTPLATGSYSHVLADNVIALVMVPKDPPPWPQQPVSSPLAASYSYSSAPVDWPPTSTAPQLKTDNQLPPLIEVTMVSIDEASAQRLQTLGSDPVETLGLRSLFADPGDLADPAQPGLAKDLKALETTLQSLKLTYRIFTSEVSIRGAKWSKEQ